MHTHKHKKDKKEINEMVMIILSSLKASIWFPSSSLYFSLLLKKIVLYVIHQNVYYLLM